MVYKLKKIIFWLPNIWHTCIFIYLYTICNTIGNNLYDNFSAKEKNLPKVQIKQKLQQAAKNTI